jgi:hypothetical protein
MFKLIDNPTFTHVVKVMVPIDGGHREETFKATYKVLKTNEINRFDLSDPGASREFLCEAVVSLEDIADAQGNPLPYSDELRDQVLALPYARSALARGYFDAVSKARSGN